jgi:RES domain-containing protein
VLTTIEIPPRIRIFEFPDADLPEGWDKPKPLKATQKIGLKWVKQGQYPVMRVPSSIVRIERNLVLNPAHPDFRFITFQAPIPFRFDPRLKS